MSTFTRTIPLAQFAPQNFQLIVSTDPAAEIATFEKNGFVGHGRKDRIPMTFTLPFDWHGTDSADRNWMFQLHAWRMIDPYLVLSMKTPANRACFERCHAVIADWIRGNTLNEAGLYTWYDMSTGMRASKLALVARLAPTFGVNLDETPGFTDMLTAHFVHLTNPEELNRGNHGLFQMWGLKSLAKAFPDHPMSDAGAAYAVRVMGELIVSQMGDMGVHTENSPDYHFFACQRIKAILNAPDWQVSEMAPIHDLMAQAELAKPWLVDLNHRVIPVGDSARGQTRSRSSLPLVEWPHRGNKTGLGAALDGYGVVRSRPDLPLADASYLFVTASFQSKVHKHDDCLSLFWQEGGADILIDSGKYAYQKDEFRTYFVSRHAHNTLEFDGKGGARQTNRPYGSGIRDVVALSDGAWLIEAQAPCSPTGELHRRRIFFQPGHRLIVFDRVKPQDDQKHRYTLWWHFAPAARPRLDGAVCRVEGLSEGRCLTIRHATQTGQLKPSLHQGEKEPRIQGWVSPEYMKYEPAPVLGLGTVAKGEFHAVTVFDWAGDPGGALPADLDPAERALALRVQSGSAG